MGYLKEFLTQINNRDFHKFLVLWEEYCTCDIVDTDELMQLLNTVKSSEMAKHFGQIVETALPLWEKIQSEKESYEILSLLIDLETTNSPLLADLTLSALKKKYGHDPKFNERLRLVGLRGKENFQGALSKYDLLAHMEKGNAVFHTGGWGTGEIIEVSFVREHLLIEFENISGRKDLSFTNAFKTLIPLPADHFRALRFLNPDHLEEQGKKDPVSLINLLLKDLGPKTAGEIKDELCELVIPEKEWTKWWQGARAKVKKDPMIESPDTLKGTFKLRKTELSAEERIKHEIQSKTDANDIIQTTYNFVRDHAGALKTGNNKQKIQDNLLELLERPDLTQDQTLQITLLLEQFFNFQNPKISLKQQVLENENIEETIHKIDIIAFKKRVLIAIKEYRSDWVPLFLSFLFTISQAQIRDYLLKELNQNQMRSILEKKLRELLERPSEYPEMFVWYFQKLVSHEDSDIPFQNMEGRCLFFEAFLILLSHIENVSEYRDLQKKMYTMLSAKRYALVRQLLQDTSLEFVKELLLLASKCQSLTDHDMKILRSLAEVVHPLLAPPKQKKGAENGVIWTTEEGYLKIQERIRQIGTVEVVENAREIEAARALGDLRENSEFKFAQERRARLQLELKTLSEQLNRARIITPDDIHLNEVGIGNIVEVEDEHGAQSQYLILGPWDANPEENILSFNSKLAQEIVGKKVGDTFSFKDGLFKITNIKSFFKVQEKYGNRVSHG